MTCSNCNAEIRPGLRFCEACGAPVAEGASPLLSRVDPIPPKPAPVRPSSLPEARARSGHGVLVLAALLLIVGGGIAGYMGYRSRQTTDIPLPVIEEIREEVPQVEEPVPELPPPPPPPPAPARPAVTPPPKPAAAPQRTQPPRPAAPQPAPAPPPSVVPPPVAAPPADPAPREPQPAPAPPPAPTRERQPILRPDPATPPPPPPKPAEEAKPRYSGPNSGVIVWSGQVERGGQVTIDGGDASGGRLNGSLPGVPVIVEIDTREFALAESPSPANGWKRLTFRARNKRHTVVTVKWSVLQ